MLIDTHCHLDAEQFEEDVDAVVARALGSGVQRLVTIATRLKKIDNVLAIAERYEQVYCSVGTHPENAADELDYDTDHIINLTNHPKVVAIGEAGLDYYYNQDTRELQKLCFIKHIEVARQTGLPLVIHSRNADDDMINILTSETGKGRFPFIFHCFSSGASLARAGMALGGYLSFSGILTFKNAASLRSIASEIPHDRLLVETDAPYLAPVPYRGKRNEPAFITKTAEVLASLLDISLDEISQITTQNAFRIFGKMT